MRSSEFLNPTAVVDSGRPGARAAGDPRKVRILAVSYSFPPMAHPRAVQVARLLQELDASVVVVCGSEDPSQSPWARDQTVAPDIERHLEHVVREPLRRSRLIGYMDVLADRLRLHWSSL